MRFFRQLYNRWFSPQRTFALKLRHLLGFTPAYLHLYKVAFTHSSSAPDVRENNERLELLGDAVYDLVVSEFLYHKYPFQNEGFLSEMRSKLVSRREINLLAQKMGLEEFLESNLTNRNLQKSSTLGNAFEALIGAVYFDQGFRRAQRFVVQKVLAVHFEMEEVETKVVNFKSHILHYAQTHELNLEFRMLEEVQTKTGKRFTMALFLNDKQMAESTATNKKAAEQDAARKTLEGLGLL